MSKICIIVARNISLSAIGNQIDFGIRAILNRYSLGAFAVDVLEEPLRGNYDGCILLSVADNDQFDNCEMLLLPDGCSFNEKKNKTCFFDRMKVFRDIAIYLYANNCRMELFVGESGTPCEEYKEVCCESGEVHHILSSMYYDANRWFERDLHIKIK